MIFNKNTKTAERPQALVSDALVRYEYARQYCKGKSVLDVGSGLGYGARFLKENGAKNVLGIDYSKETILKANELKIPGLEFISSNALEIRKLNKKFDVVLAFEILEHLKESAVERFIDSLYSILNKDGILLLSTPNALESKYFFGRPYNAYHVREYGGFEVKNLLRQKFNSVEIFGYRCINNKYIKSQKAISSSYLSKIIYFIGSYKWLRELLAYIPDSVKKNVTQENTLPRLDSKDFELTKNFTECPGIFAVAKNKVNISKKELPLISIVIPFYNDEKYLESCLTSVLKITYPKFEVVLCDDASTDKSAIIAQKFVKKDKRIKLITNTRNRGAAASKNLGVKSAVGDIVLFLDSDTEVEKEFASELVEELLTDKNLSAAQSIIMDWDNRTLIQQAGGLLNPRRGYLKALKQWEKFEEVKRKGLLNKKNIVGVSGSLAVKRYYFERVRGFDEHEARHSEDVDFSWRIWVLGGKIRLIPTSRIYHKNKPMSERALMHATSEYIHFHLVRNSIRSMIKNYELTNVIIYLPIALVLNLGRVLVACIQPNPSIIKGTLKGIWWNIANLPDSLIERRYIQSSRKIRDNELFKYIFINSKW